MLLKLLALFDLLGLILLIFSVFNFIFLRPLIGIAVFLITKFVIFQDIASFFDLIVGVYVIFILLGFSNTILTLIAIGYLIQKIIFSFV